MAKIDKTNQTRLKINSIAILHIFLGLVLISQLIAFDAAKLMTPEAVMKRWIVVAGFIVVAATVWYVSRLNNHNFYQHKIVWLLCLADLILASFMVYTTRGMASKAVLLFVLPILVAATTAKKGVILFSGIISAIVYSSVVVAYFVINFNEGYKIELYGEIGFYAAFLLIFAMATYKLTKKY